VRNELQVLGRANRSEAAANDKDIAKNVHTRFNRDARRVFSSAHGPLGRHLSRMSFLTDFTPATPRATWTALSMSA
jgi:hypothetical protein